jgi:hypothetical protein
MTRRLSCCHCPCTVVLSTSCDGKQSKRAEQRASRLQGAAHECGTRPWRDWLPREATSHAASRSLLPVSGPLPTTPDISDNAQMDARHDFGAAEGEATSHRADGPAKIALPDQPWWRTALANHRGVLLAAFVMVAYAGLGVRAFQRGDSLVGLACLVLAVGTVASLIGWLRPAHRLRRWATLSLLLLVVAPFVWLYVSR